MSIVFVHAIIIPFLFPPRLGPLGGVFPDYWGVPHYAIHSITVPLVISEAIGKLPPWILSSNPC